MKGNTPIISIAMFAGIVVMSLVSISIFSQNASGDIGEILRLNEAAVKIGVGMLLPLGLYFFWKGVKS